MFFLLNCVCGLPYTLQDVCLLKKIWKSMENRGVANLNIVLLWVIIAIMWLIKLINGF